MTFNLVALTQSFVWDTWELQVQVIKCYFWKATVSLERFLTENTPCHPRLIRFSPRVSPLPTYWGHVCGHLTQPSPDSCCRLTLCSTCSQMGKCSVSRGEGWGWCPCTCNSKCTNARELEAQSNKGHRCEWFYRSSGLVSWGPETNSPEKGVLQVQEVAGLWSCLVHLGNNTDVVALSVREKTSVRLKWCRPGFHRKWFVRQWDI